MTSVLYVYAVTRDAATPDAEGIDGTTRFGVASESGLHAIFTAVSASEFSQEVIDQRAGDLEWLGAIGYRHQAVMAELMKHTALVPLRAFTLFSSEETLRAYLSEQSAWLRSTLERLDGKQEWTLRIELEPEQWSQAVAQRIASLRDLQNEIGAASPGKAFLLRKKLEEEKKRASHAAEEELVREIEGVVMEKLGRETLAETRQRRDGAFPQINVLLARDEDAVLQELRDAMAVQYEQEGVTLALTGPWPPYTFVGTMNAGS